MTLVGDAGIGQRCCSAVQPGTAGQSNHQIAADLCLRVISTYAEARQWEGPEHYRRRNRGRRGTVPPLNARF